MKYYLWPRGSGKTTKCIMEIVHTKNVYLIVPNEQRRKTVLHVAQAFCNDDALLWLKTHIFTVADIKAGKNLGVCNQHSRFVIDELEATLHILLSGLIVTQITDTPTE